jgi:hypothetical protein
MGTAVACYRRPESAEDVAEVVRVFLGAEFGMDARSYPAEGPAPASKVLVDLNSQGADREAMLLVVGREGYPYVLDESEMEAVEAMRKGPADRTKVMKLTATEAAMVEAHRNRDNAFRPAVIAGFVEPTTVEELVEVVRTFLDVNFGWCLDEHRDRHRIDIQGDYNEDGLPQTSIFFCEGEYGRDVTAALDPDELENLAKFRAAKEADREANARRLTAEREARRAKAD